MPRSSSAWLILLISLTTLGQFEMNNNYFVGLRGGDVLHCERTGLDLRKGHAEAKMKCIYTFPRFSEASCLSKKFVLVLWYTTMSSFSLPPIHDNPDGGWGPSTSNFPDQFKFKDIPYAPYSKSDKLGRFADWNDLSSDNRQTASGLPPTQNARGGGPGGRRRDGTQAFGSGTASAFAYFHVEDESSFSLVDNKAAPARRGTGFNRGRGGMRGTPGYVNVRGTARGGRGGTAFRGGASQRGGPGQRRGWRDWEKACSIYISKECLSYIHDIEQSRPRIIRGHFSSMEYVGRSRIPSSCQAAP